MALNQPRTIPYAFRVFESEGFIWLYDDSERTYLCNATPSVFAEPVTSIGDTDENYPDPSYLNARDVERDLTIEVSLDCDDTTPDADRDDAWQAAREDVCANCGYYFGQLGL